MYSFVVHSYANASPGSGGFLMSMVDCRTRSFATLLPREGGVGHGGGHTAAERNRENGLHARPHPGPLPRGEGEARSPSPRPSPPRRGGGTLALTPALSPRRGGGTLALTPASAEATAGRPALSPPPSVPLGAGLLRTGRRGGGARDVCGKRGARVLARLLGGRATARQRQPRRSSFQTAPGPSPSPRGRGPG